MKIHPGHASEVASHISTFVSKHAQAIEDHGKNVSPKRLRWDVFHKAVPYSVTKQIYEYANDENIDTLLRKIFKHAKD